MTECEIMHLSVLRIAQLHVKHHIIIADGAGLKHTSQNNNLER